MDELVQRLAEGNHPVKVGGVQSSLSDFERRLKEIGYVFIKFTQTRGGPDLGVRVDQTKTHLNQADFGKGTGQAHVEGTLKLNYVNVRCVADIDLATLEGTGHLVVVDE